MKFINSGNGILKAVYKKYENSDVITEIVRVKCDLQRKISPIDSCLNVIRVSENLKKNFGEEKYFVLVNLSNGEFINVIVDEQTVTDSESNVCITNFVAKTLKIQDASEIVLCCQKQFEFTGVKSQKLENIKNDVIVVPEVCLQENWVSDFSLFEILNPLTNESIFVQTKYIKTEKELKPGEIRINKKQRTMLSDNIPVRLSAKQYDELVSEAQNQGNTKELLESNYKKDGLAYVIRHNIEQIPFSVRISLQKLVKSKFGEKLILCPVLESYRKPVKNSIIKKVCDFL